MNPIFIPKDDQELPDTYGFIIYYLDGKSESFELAAHFFNKETGILDFCTKDDIWNWIPISSIKRIEWDKCWSKIVTIKQKSEK